MKKKIILLVAAITLLCGCGTKTIPVLENGQEAVVTFKDGSMISVDELYNSLKNSYATNTLIEMIDKKILEEKYSEDLDDAKTYAESYIESLKNYYPEEGELLSAIQNVGYNSIEDFQETVRINYLRNLAIEDYTESLITEKEIEKYYKNEIVADREVAHIQIIPETSDTMTNDEKTAAKEEALATAKSVIAKLKKGESFEDLAKEYSNDDATKDNGGSLGTINKGDYGSDVFDNEVYSLKVGKYSTTPVETTVGYEIVYVISEKEKASLEDSKEKIIEALKNEKLEADESLQITAMTELRKEFGMEIIDSEVEDSYNKYIRNILNNINNN